jgi:hypothetical protein
MKYESSEHAIRVLQNQIHCLIEEQTDAMETATFIGLTIEESEQYGQRSARIVELVRQLRLLESAAA